MNNYEIFNITFIGTFGVLAAYVVFAIISKTFEGSCSYVIEKLEDKK